MRRILLVEDDRGMAHGLRYNLETEGYAVVHAADGRSGIECARASSFDLILLDLMLPHRSGFDVLRDLRADGDRTPVILMSARDAEDDRIEGLALGADDFIAKPFGLGELLARIRARTRTARKVAVLDSALNAAAGSQDLGEALASLVDKALGLIGAERGLVIVQHDDGALETHLARGRRSEGRRSKGCGGEPLPLDARFSTTIVQRVLESGRTEAMLDADDSTPWGGGSIVDLRLRQAVCTPLRVGQRITGVLYADSRISAQGFGREDLELIETLAAQCAALIDRARLRRASREQRRMEAELTDAKHLQQSMLPDVPVHAARLEIAGFNRPCEEAGGDYFDYIHLGEERVALVIGDVAGHGVGAALFMAAARSLLRTFLLGIAGRSSGADRAGSCLPCVSDVGDVLGEVNRALIRDMPAGAFMSLVLGELDLRTGGLRYASAGHTPGIVYRAATGDFDELLPTGPALGVVEHARYEVCTVVPPLQCQDAVLLYTDGATEAMGEDREMFGVERLKTALARVHGDRAPGIVDSLTQEITEHSAGRLADDVSFLVVKATDCPVAAA